MYILSLVTALALNFNPLAFGSAVSAAHAPAIYVQEDTDEENPFAQEELPEFQSSLQLSLEQKADVRCAVAFAIVAGGQGRGEAPALAYPLLGARGRIFFADLGQRLLKDLEATPQQVQLLLESEARAFHIAAQQGNDSNGTVDAVMKPCLLRLDAAVPPPPKPGLLECAAILGLAYDEVFAREGLSPTARDLKTQASILDGRARDALRAEGKSAEDIDFTLDAVKNAIAADAAALEEQGKSPNLDYNHCIELAKS